MSGPRAAALLRTRLTERFGLSCPVVSAPMANAGGGVLAAAVSRAGGLGLVGGGYCHGHWVVEQMRLAGAGGVGVGVGFITWALSRAPGVLDAALECGPQAVMLSFGDPAPLAGPVLAAGVPLMCQVQRMSDVERAVEVGAEVIVAQGAEAGGHGASEQGRGTMTFVPEVRDWIDANSPDTLLLAAGGVADGRGLAAALALGADGALVGTRLWASEEALVAPGTLEAAVAASGDDTIRTSVVDAARGLLADWPRRYNCRVLNTDFVAEHARIGWPRAEAWSAEGQRAFEDAWHAGDAANSTAIVGEAAGLIRDIRPAGEIVTGMVNDAARILGRGPS